MHCSQQWTWVRTVVQVDTLMVLLLIKDKAFDKAWDMARQLTQKHPDKGIGLQYAGRCRIGSK